MKHKHAEIIKAWADGAEIEWKNNWGEWETMPKNWPWYQDWEYRVKPKPQPDYQLIRRVTLSHTPSFPSHPDGILQVGRWPEANVMFTFDGETHELKKVELI